MKSTAGHLADDARVPELVYWPVGHSQLSLPEHLEIAQAGGFSSLAIAPTRAKALFRQGLTAGDLREMAEEKGIRYTHLDGIATWVTDWQATKGDPDLNAWIRALFDIDMREALEIGAALGAEAVVAVPFFDPGSIARDELIESFACFCDIAREFAIEVNVEAIPFWGLRDLSSAWDIVSAAGKDNSGIIVDTWHVQKGSSDYAHEVEVLRAIPGERLKHVQLADAELTPCAETLSADVMFRKFPGEGELDLVGMLSIIMAKGHLRSVGPEVVNRDLDAISTAEIGKVAGKCTRRVVDQATEMASAARGDSW